VPLIAEIVRDAVDLGILPAEFPFGASMMLIVDSDGHISGMPLSPELLMYPDSAVVAARRLFKERLRKRGHGNSH
jgi:hypothetical protein